MKPKGFALTEVIVVIAILATLLTIATIDFNSWTKKSQVERQTRELFADLNQARMDSFFMKKRHKVVMQPQGYVFYRFSSADESRTTGGTQLLSKTVSYQMTKENGTTSIADRIFEFDIRGFTNDLDTIRVNATGISAQVDCIVVHYGRTNLGKIENNECVLK